MLMQTHEARLDALRKELARQGLDGFVIPLSDEHLSEYVGGYAQRLAWLTGFGGSAGTAAVLKNTAYPFVETYSGTGACVRPVTLPQWSTCNRNVAPVRRTLEKSTPSP